MRDPFANYDAWLERPYQERYENAYEGELNEGQRVWVIEWDEFGTIVELEPWEDAEGNEDGGVDYSFGVTVTIELDGVNKRTGRKYREHMPEDEVWDRCEPAENNELAVVDKCMQEGIEYGDNL